MAAGLTTARAVAMAMAKIAHLPPRPIDPFCLPKLLPLLHPRFPHLQIAPLSLVRSAPSAAAAATDVASAVVSAAPAQDFDDDDDVQDDASTSSNLLEKLRNRQLRDRRAKSSQPSKPKSKTSKTPLQAAAVKPGTSTPPLPNREPVALASSFRELSLSDELMAAVEELNLTQPTEVQCRAIPEVLDGQSVVVASHTGSGKTLAYMFPVVQRLRREEMQEGKVTRARRPRAVVLCPTRELAEQVFRVAKSICHNARFRAALIGGGVRLRPQEDALNSPVDMLVGTPGRVLKHIEERNMSYGDIKYVVLDEADTMFDRGFGPDIRKFLGPLRNRSCKLGDPGFQTILVTATITKAVQKLLDEEFPGIRHIQTSTLHKKVSTARHSFIKLSGTENKLESLLQVLEPSLAKGDRAMVFCNTLNSCRAVDHFLSENNVQTVNYHGAVPAEERVEVLNKFKNEAENCPALVCTDLAARGLDLVVDHVIMFDFPLNSIDYLHRTGRTARMGAKGKITSLVTRRSLVLAELIEEAMRKGESLEGISLTKEKVEISKARATRNTQSGGKGRTIKAATGKEKEKIIKTAAGNRSSAAKGPKGVISKPTKSPVVRLVKGPVNVKSGTNKSPMVRLAKGPVNGKTGMKKTENSASKRVLKVSRKR